MACLCSVGGRLEDQPTLLRSLFTTESKGTNTGECGRYKCSYRCGEFVKSIRDAETRVGLPPLLLAGNVPDRLHIN